MEELVVKNRDVRLTTSIFMSVAAARDVAYFLNHRAEHREDKTYGSRESNSSYMNGSNNNVFCHLSFGLIPIYGHQESGSVKSNHW